MSMDVIKGRDETLLRVVMLNTSLLSNKPKTIDTQFGFNQCEKNCRPRITLNYSIYAILTLIG